MDEFNAAETSVVCSMQSLWIIIGRLSKPTVEESHEGAEEEESMNVFLFSSLLSSCLVTFLEKSVRERKEEREEEELRSGCIFRSRRLKGTQGGEVKSREKKKKNDDGERNQEITRTVKMKEEILPNYL